MFPFPIETVERPIGEMLLRGQAWRALSEQDPSLASQVLRFLALGDEATAVKLLLGALAVPSV